MTSLSILITDVDRENNATQPWRASLMVGAMVSPNEEAVGRGNTPERAVLDMMARTDLLAEEPEDCPECGVVTGTEAHRTWHDSEGNCYSHRRPH